MGTRGAIGFRVNGEDKIMYNHLDSYPDALGEDMTAFAKKVSQDIQKYKQLAESLIMIDDKKREPTQEQIDKAKKMGLIDEGVSTGNKKEWYVLLRNAQGNPESYLEFGYAESAGNFLHDSLWCEFAYIINFDTKEIEYYRGFNKDKNAAGRYALKGREKVNETEYFGVALVGTSLLSAIPDDWKERFYPEEKEEEAA